VNKAALKGLLIHKLFNIGTGPVEERSIAGSRNEVEIAESVI